MYRLIRVQLVSILADHSCATLTFDLSSQKCAFDAIWKKLESPSQLETLPTDCLLADEQRWPQAWRRLGKKPAALEVFVSTGEATAYFCPQNDNW